MGCPLIDGDDLNVYLTGDALADVGGDDRACTRLAGRAVQARQVAPCVKAASTAAGNVGVCSTRVRRASCRQR